MLGNQVTIPGKSIKIVMVMKSQAIKGMTALMALPEGTSLIMPWAIKTALQTGGEINPISIIFIIMTPNQNGSKPTAVTIGTKMGTEIGRAHV